MANELQRAHEVIMSIVKTCSIVGCNGLHVAKGLCDKHYRRLKRGSLIEAKTQIEKTPEERFLEKVSILDYGNCWLFGHVPDDKNTVFDTDEYTYGWHTACKRCGIWDIDYHEQVTGSRSYKIKQFFIYWLYRKWWPEKCSDCGRRYGKHFDCIPF